MGFDMGTSLSVLNSGLSAGIRPQLESWFIDGNQFLQLFFCKIIHELFKFSVKIQDRTKMIYLSLCIIVLFLMLGLCSEAW